MPADRISRGGEPALLSERFKDEPGKTLRDLLVRYGPEAVKLLD